MDKTDYSKIFESSKLFLLKRDQPGITYALDSPTIPSSESMDRLVDDIRERMYYLAGDVFANLESLAYATSTKSEKRGIAKYRAVLIGGALAYACVWLSTGAEQDELPKEIAQTLGLWAPAQIRTKEDMTWSTRALCLGQTEWDRDPVLQEVVSKHTSTEVAAADLDTCHKAAGFVKYILAVTVLYNETQHDWIQSQITEMETGTRTD